MELKLLLMVLMWAGCACKAQDWWCGNFPLHGNETCYCSKDIISKEDYSSRDKRCCPSPDPGSCQWIDDGNVRCNKSTAYNIQTQSCNGECFFKDPDGLDDENEEPECPTPTVSTKGSTGHKQCFPRKIDSRNDRKYDCVNRRDEEISARKQANTTLYNSVTRCENATDSKGETVQGPGLWCGDRCLASWDWCLGVDDLLHKQINCGDFTINDTNFCQNFTFWEKQDCNRYDNNNNTEVYGERCRGQKMGCHYPSYMQYDYNNESQPCADFSDQIHKVGSTCSIDHHLNIYKDLFCNSNTGAKKGTECQKIRDDPEEWIKEQRNESKTGILDPHNCQASCLTRGYGCEACTNRSYFRCPVNGRESCLHPDLECDGHPQCDNAEDEDFWKCRPKLIKLKRIKEIATFMCLSKMYPDKNHWTAAVACDGNVECHEDQDEGALCGKISVFSWIGVPLCFAIMLCVAAGHKWYFENKEKNKTKRKKAKETKNERNCTEKISEEMIKSLHETNKEKNLNIKLLRNDLLNDKETRIKGSFTFFRCELERNKENLAETVCSIKKYLYDSVYNVVIRDCFPGFARTYCAPIFDLLKKLKKIKWCDWLFVKVKQLAVIYIDNFKDILLVVSILTIVGLRSLYYFPTELSSIVVFCLIASIISPMLLSSLVLAVETIEESQLNLSWLDKTKIIVTNLVICLFNPVRLINRLEKLKDDLNQSAVENETDEVLKYLAEELTVRKKYTNLVRLDLQLETINQTSLQIMLLLLSSTYTPTTGGLEAFFQNTSTIWMILSILWSMKTSFTEHLKHVSIEKPHLRIRSKILVYFVAALAASKRILVLVMFFVPSLGLFSILHHWQAEQIPFKFGQQFCHELKKKHFSFSFKETDAGDCLYGPVAWSLLDRTIYSDPSLPQPPDYDLYTGLKLRQYFLLFVLLYVLQTAAVFITKYIVVEEFRKINMIKQFAHSLENSSGIVFPLRDWDVDHGTVEDHRERFSKVNREVILTMVVNFFFNLVMLLPLIYTGSKIFERHNLLGKTIGTIPEENNSYENVWLLLLIVLPFFIFTSILEPVAFLVYQSKFHPWKDILTDKRVTTAELHEIETSILKSRSNETLHDVEIDETSV